MVGGGEEVGRRKRNKSSGSFRLSFACVTLRQAIVGGNEVLERW